MKAWWALAPAVLVLACGLDRSGGRPSDGAAPGGAAGDGGMGLAPVGPGASSGGFGASGGSDGGSGGRMGCSSPSDCPRPATLCEPATCDDGVCGTSFAPAGTDCQSEGGVTCDGAGFCLLAIGSGCIEPTSCDSGQCEQGVCCTTGCTTACLSCALPGTIGTCSPVPPGQDPTDACEPGVCTADGGCVAGTFLWDLHIGANNAQQPRTLAVDGDDSIVVGGQFTGTVDFGGGPIASQGNGDVFLVRVDQDGGHVWSDSYGAGGVDRLLGLALEGGGAMAIAGSFTNNIDFGGGPLNTSNGDTQAFVAVFEKDGTHRWSRAFGGSSSNQFANAVAFDPSDGDVIVTGGFLGSIDFGTGNVTSVGSRDLYVVELDGATGALEWVYLAGNGNLQEGLDLVVRADGTVTVTGSTAGAIDFGGGVLPTLGGADVFLLELTEPGLYAGARRFGSNGDDFGFALARDATGRTALGGLIEGAVDFGGGALPFGGDDDGFVALFDAAGDHVWSKSYGGSADERVQDLAFDSMGRLIAGGTDDDDLGVLKLDTEGSTLWSLVPVAAADQSGRAVGADGSDNVLFTAQFEGTVDVGGGALVAIGSEDALVAKLAP